MLLETVTAGQMHGDKSIGQTLQRHATLCVLGHIGLLLSARA
jgi:hypothetical protein